MLKKLRILIVEDEKGSAEKLADYLKIIDSGYEIVSSLTCVKSTRQWLMDHEDPDIIFLDIHLADGLAFDIFKSLETDAYVIFLTAYQEYALKAFELNSIDYILKPFDEADIRKGLEKYDKRVTHHPARFTERLASMNVHEEFKSRFMVKRGTKIIPVEVDEVAYFYIESFVILVTTENARYMIDLTLDQLEAVLNPKTFFRINRQCISSYKAITSVDKIFNNRLRVFIKPSLADELIVSQKRSAQFKVWLNL